MPEVLPDLGLVVVAGFLLLIGMALWLIEKFVANSFGRLPVIGGWIRSNVDNALNDARDWVFQQAGSAWDGAVRLFEWAGNYLWTIYQNVVLWARAAVTTISHTLTVTIPALENSLIARIIDQGAAAEAYARTLFGQASKDIAAAEAAAIRQAETWYHDATAYTDQAVTAAEKALAADITAAERTAAAGLSAAEQSLTAAVSGVASSATADLNALASGTNADIARLARDISQSVGAAESIAASNLSAVQAGIYTDLQSWGDQAVTNVWPDAADDIATLRKVIGSDFPWLNDLLGALGGLGAAGLAGALVRSMAGTEAITRLAADCIVPNCRNLSGLGNDLAQLLGDASLAAMLAWLIFAVTDPAGWAQETYDVAGAPLAAVASAASHLIGGP